MKAYTLPTVICLFLTILCNRLHSQKVRPVANPVYVDKAGILRWTETKREASFFGVNYTTPFAFAYRAHKKLGLDIEKSIRQDVYHFSRLGFNAFRVHVWDTEISDSAGNLLDDENLRLFDFLLAELRKRNIYTIITPIAFWGNGYPERDENTPGFARKYGKGGSTTNDTAIIAQENYLKQFYNHVNPYTNLRYQDDPFVIATEINNEPSHSGPKSLVIDYINRLAKAIRQTGWSKPVYYNISQGPYYGDAVAKSDIDGVSFQWYPSGLVANNMLKGNYLPHVNNYTIPFDTIKEYRNKSRMVYEFDAADIYQSYMYPAMARSFREAGFQWATQFAYDPLAIAHANTEYQTHYLNLAYTPSKAVSMLIAGEVFRSVPRGMKTGGYPGDSSFSDFTVSYRTESSVMNSESKFYYSNNTDINPKSINKLSNVAGVGNSSLIQYKGTGVYFLDKLTDGIWRLEVMPDAVMIRDPFERASPDKEVVRIEWRNHPMKIAVPDLGESFSIEGINEGNTFSARAASDSFSIQPGTYILRRANIEKEKIDISSIAGRNEFVAPKPHSNEIALFHEPYSEVSAGKPFYIIANIAVKDSARVSLQVNRVGGGQGRFIPMVERSAGQYSAEIPVEMLSPGQVTYRIIVQRGQEYALFPGNYKANPFAWDSHHLETYKTFVASPGSNLVLFEAYPDRATSVFPNWRRGFQVSYVAGNDAGKLAMRMSATGIREEQLISVQKYIGDRILARSSELSSYNSLVIRAKVDSGIASVKVTLTDRDANSYSAIIKVGTVLSELSIPLSDFRPDSLLLLPRPYPGFLPLSFNSSGATIFSLSQMERMQLTTTAKANEDFVIQIESAWLKKND